jgi:hypothetical protein
MKRPIRWYWAAVCSLLVFHAAALVTGVLLAGLPIYGDEGPLEDATEWVYQAVDKHLGHRPATVITVLLLVTPAALATMFTYAYLRGPHDARDGYLHCLKCDYILKGLSEPRCPECGERI